MLCGVLFEERASGRDSFRVMGLRDSVKVLGAVLSVCVLSEAIVDVESLESISGGSVLAF